MRKYLLLVLLGVFGAGLAQPARAQTTALACGNGRYVADVFPTVTKKTDIIFGYNTAIDYGTGATTPVTLKLDFYEPAGDPAVKRPLIIMAFGGAFIQGQRQDLDDLGQAFAHKGYTLATIDYRLVQPGTFNLNYLLLYSRPDLLADEIIRACADMKAAIRYFKHDAATVNTYRIDPTKIFVGGLSAGAITALQTAYTDSPAESPTLAAAYASNGGLEGNTDFPAPNNLLPTYRAIGIAGVFNIAGGVADLNIVSAGNPPLYSAQGTADEVVPYDCGTVNPSTYVLCGSHQIQLRATQVGIANQLHPVVGGNHASPGNEPDRSQIIAEASTFLQALVCATAPLSAGAASPASPLLIAPNPIRDQLSVSGLPAGRSQLLLYDATGRLVGQARAEGAATWPTADLPPGLYFLKALNEAGTTIGSAKILKE